MTRKLSFYLLIVFLSHALAGRCPAASSKDTETEKLKARTTEFFTAVQMAQWSKTEQYVIEKSRDNFKSQHHGKILGFKIVDVKMEAGEQSALVEVAYTILVPTIVRSIDIPDVSRWKLVSGEWFFDPDDPPPSPASKFQEYYYDKVAARKAGKLPPLAIHFDRDVINIGVVEKGKILNLRFPFTNGTSQQIRIEELSLRAPFLKDTTKKITLKPGEKGEVSVDLDTSALLWDFEHALYVEFQPIKEMVPLTIKGKVLEAKDIARSKTDKGPSDARSPGNKPVKR